MANWFKNWFTDMTPREFASNGRIFDEKRNAREKILGEVRSSLLDHHVGLTALSKLGYSRARKRIEARLPTKSRIRSGDIGEILASEYLEQVEGCVVPVKRLRFKDDPDMSMRGEDVVALRFLSGGTKVIKVEAKSKSKIDAGVFTKANDALLRDYGRPKSSTLAFIVSRLEEKGDEEMAAAVEDFLLKRRSRHLYERVLFVLSQNAVSTSAPKWLRAQRNRKPSQFVSVRVDEHQTLIATLYSEFSYEELRRFTGSD